MLSKSIRHHEWKEGGEEEDASEEKVESDKLVAIVEMDEKKQKSTQVAAPMVRYLSKILFIRGF